MRYALYNFCLDYIHKDARKYQKELGLKLEKGHKGLEKLIPNLHWISPNFSETMDFLIVSEEYLWLQNQRKSYYPEDHSVIKSWLNSQIDIKDPSSFYENETFTLNIPVDLLNDIGELGSGVLVTIYNIDEKENVVKAFGKKAGFYIRGFERSKTMKEGTTSISANYTTRSDGKGVTSRVTITDNVMSEIIRDPDFENYKRIISEHNEMKFRDYIEIETEAELYTQFCVVKMIAGFLLYRKAMPHLIHEGLPSGLRKNFETPTIDRRSHYVIKRPEASEASDRDYHIRRSHYRQLTHPRYYKGDYQNKVVGSRIVLVSASMVGRKTTDYTVSNQ